MFTKYLWVFVLIGLLGDEQFRVRERAFKILAREEDLGVVICLLKASNTIPDLEISQRCKVIAGKWLAKHGDRLYPILFKEDHRFPWISSVPEGYASVHHWLDKIDGDSNKVEWVRYRKATAELIKHLLKTDPWSVYSLLTEMMLGDRDWIDSSNTHYDWPCSSRRFVR